MKAFALVRGVSSGTLYLYPREVWEYMMNKDPKTYGLVFEFVVDSGDKQELVQLQALVNKDIEMEE